MKLQDRDIKTNMRGEDVARLQEALQTMGFEIREGELEQRRYGKDSWGSQRRGGRD